MPPYLTCKSSYVRREFDDFENRSYSKHTVIRTDFILQNVFSDLLKDHYVFDAISAMNEKEKNVYSGMIETVGAFKASYASTVKALCTEIDVINEDTVGSILLGVSNELFSEGITWSRIIAFFVFVGELTIMCISKKLPKTIVDVMYECFSRLVKEKLESWIEDHDGWEGITSLSFRTQEDSMKMSNPSWAKSLLHTTVRMIGTFASFANTSNNCI